MSEEDVSKSTRISLKRVPSFKENFVDRPSKTLKHDLSQECPLPVDVEVKLSSKETQANLDTTISEDELTNPKVGLETYWQKLAEKRQISLQDTLDENERLHKIIEDLREENALFKQLLHEANSFVEVIKEELANTSKDDTGIDVNDVSTADETIPDEETKV